MGNGMNMTAQTSCGKLLHELYRLAVLKKGFSDIESLDNYLVDLLNVPDIRLASRDQVLAATAFLEGLDHRVPGSAKSVEFEIV